MMIKTIDIPFTGQPIVRLLDDKLTKTASNDIQDYWQSLQKSPKYAYLHVLAMTDSNHYGPNNNGDWFNEEDLKKYHNTFCSDAHIFLHHVNKDPARSIGRPIYSFYNDNMHRVELILAIEKNNPLAVDTIGKIKRGEQLYVSMGCKVPYDICSICGHQSRTRLEYCNHLKFQMKQILDDGRQVYAINPPPLKFFDISIVTRPADRVAWALDKMACENAQAFSQEHIMVQQDMSKEALEILGHEINKFSEILKTVDGEVLDYKDLDQPLIDKLKFISNMPKADMELPEYGGSAPIGTLIRISISKGIPPTWGEIGRSLLGSEASEHLIGQAMHGLRGATDLLMHNPMHILHMLKNILHADDHKEHKDIEIVLTKRAEMFKKAQLPLYQAGNRPDILPSTWAAKIPNLYKTMEMSNNYAPGMATPVIAHDEHGNLYKTNRYNAIISAVPKAIPSMPAGLAQLAMSMASVGVLLAGLTPINIAAAAALAMGAIGLEGKSNKVQVDIPLRGEVDRGTYFNKAAGSVIDGNSIRKVITPSIQAAVIPMLLGADYLFNSKIRHRNDPYYRENMGTVSRTLDRAGEFVVNHPFATMGTVMVGKGMWGASRNLKK